MTQLINHVLIVGGGTAGWLTAGILAKQFNCQSENAVKVTLIESPNIPIVGVGEGTWPTIRNTLHSIGIDESEFMRECDATFKQGSEFANWMMPNDDQSMHRYYHPLSAVFHSAYDFSLAPYWLLDKKQGRLPYDLAVATQARICQLGLAPKKITTPSYEGIQNYSYHLNANKFATFLTKHCVEKLGVRHLKANVIDAETNESGYIQKVMTDNIDIETVSADFFIDCSGAKSILLGEKLNVPWHEITDVIFNDTALAMQVPYESEDTPIATHTIATAHDAGWTWDIGLHNRRGVGYVYSSQHSTDGEAEKILRAYVGSQAGDLECRKIKMKTGYRSQFWKNNCVAIGMSAAFIEPLEASAIFLIEAAAKMLADQFPRTLESVPLVMKKFNDTFSMRWEKTIDFVKLHYCISDRRDTSYWKDNVNPNSIPDTLLEKLEHWKFHPPSKYDFEHSFEPFVLDSYLYVLYGMNFPTDLSHNESHFTQTEEASIRFDNIHSMTHGLRKELPNQRELIEKVYQFGFQTI